MTIDAFVDDASSGKRTYSITIDGGHRYVVGEEGVRSIVPVQVAGDNSRITWFDVYGDDEFHIRINPKYVMSVALYDVANSIWETV